MMVRRAGGWIEPRLCFVMTIDLAPFLFRMNNDETMSIKLNPMLAFLPSRIVKPRLFRCTRSKLSVLLRR